ncbi:VPLPA-CTERM sorting domain-containing protein [Roseobacter sinensis]|uniref:VPLPA-CTERM sorting domain-containing protein n=1 Tax=Roseobacter sinensis TaxID=2931391 RepID=A0ABT3BHH1_9RHOB|nr:VPLPA-CTERM sorting domain-containing protein [Roseobacter sp. WL0113]MCV3272564.1 VPLPA-CTERM sorting domain-containing protein [Roseobacter sp. WL0113]
MRKVFVLAAFAAVTAAESVRAAVVDGLVTSGRGVFEQIVDPTGLMVGDNNQQSRNLFAFDERQGLELQSDLQLDVGGTVSSGTVVSSHYVFFDPVNSNQEGYVDFDAPIIGLITSTANLLGSDFLGLGSVSYLNPNNRGLEGNDDVGIDPSNGSRVLVDWLAASPGDYIRVITSSDLSVTPIPVPASAAMLLSGLGVMVLARRRRRKS